MHRSISLMAAIISLLGASIASQGFALNAALVSNVVADNLLVAHEMIAETGQRASKELEARKKGEKGEKGEKGYSDKLHTPQSRRLVYLLESIELRKIFKKLADENHLYYEDILNSIAYSKLFDWHNDGFLKPTRKNREILKAKVLVWLMGKDKTKYRELMQSVYQYDGVEDFYEVTARRSFKYLAYFAMLTTSTIMLGHYAAHFGLWAEEIKHRTMLFEMTSVTGNSAMAIGFVTAAKDFLSKFRNLRFKWMFGLENAQDELSKAISGALASFRKEEHSPDAPAFELQEMRTTWLEILSLGGIASMQNLINYMVADPNVLWVEGGAAGVSLGLGAFLYLIRSQWGPLFKTADGKKSLSLAKLRGYTERHLESKLNFEEEEVQGLSDQAFENLSY